MLTDIVAHIARANGLEDNTAKLALGIILNSAERQGSPLASEIFKSVPGARALAARTGSDIGAPTGEIARLIEQTPGGRKVVITSMFTSLHKIGLDHKAIGELLPSIGTYMEEAFEMNCFGHLGDLIGSEADINEAAKSAAA